MQQDPIDKIARTPLSQILIFAAVLTLLRVGIYFYTKNLPAHRKTGGTKFMMGISEFADSLIYAAVFIFMVIRPYFFQTFRIPSGSMVPTLMVGDFIGLNKAIYRYSEPQRGDIVVFRPPAEACTPDQIDEDGSVKVDFVKRLIGLPGDLIEMKQGQIFVNDVPLKEDYKHLTRSINPDHTLFETLKGQEAKDWPKQNWKLVKYQDQLIPLNYTEFDANAQIPRGTSSGYPYFSVEKYFQSDPAVMEQLKAMPAQKIPAKHFLFMGDNRNGSLDGRAWGLIERSNVIGRAEFIWLPINRIGKPKIVPNGE